MVTEATTEEGEYEIVHELEDELAANNAHAELLKAPPVPPSLQFIEPVGVDVTLLVSVAVAVKLIVFPMMTEATLVDMLVLVVANDGLVTVNADVPELAA